ncbi:MAG: hypothetical protein ABEJ58_03240 [Halodesulfurarchaeum sp.]
MVLVLDADDIYSVIDLADLLDVVETAFVKQGTGEVERTACPSYEVGLNPDATTRPAGTAFIMPVYIHGRSTSC